MTRLIFIILFFLISLLTVFKAPAYYLWMFSIIVTEYPLIFVGIMLLLLGWGYWVVPYRTAGNWIGVVALLLFLSPIVRAQLLSEDLREDMAKQFSGNGRPPIFPGRRVFSVSRLFDGVNNVGAKSITYVKYADTALTLDLYRAQTDDLILPHRPCIISVHGGSWAKGDSNELPEINSHLARKGYNVAAINYRLAPKYKTPAPVEDVKNALDYLTKHAGELEIDTNNFVLMGHSAGAQIALLAAYTLHDKRIKGVIDFYGPADMVWGWSIPSNPLIMDSRKVMSDYIGGAYPQVPEKYAACSPVEFVDNKTIPTLMIHGGNDPLVSPEHCRRLSAKLQQHGIRYYWLQLPWATHGFDYNMNGPGGQLSTFAVETFLNTICPTPP